MSRLTLILQLCVFLIPSTAVAEDVSHSTPTEQETSMTPSDDCRILKFNPELKDFSLQGFVIKSVEVQRESVCKVRCFQEHNCLSLNIGPSEENGAYLCELSDSDHEMHPEALKPIDGFNYHSTENACAKNPCPLHHSCQNGFTYKGYRCEALANSAPNELETSTTPAEFSSSALTPPTISTRPSSNTTKSILALPTVSSAALTSAVINDTDECANNSQVCGVRARCINTKTSYGCTCKEGLHVTGGFCSGAECRTIIFKTPIHDKVMKGKL
ncbi:uncharacterized protein LOC111325781 [Stylophora pistillata]|uniref:uncharacterized protein LOC111325781 n=1 Tax=Stylophora pistillata TaxID=50429 RepID=UPI000C03E47F|nr:uncharacterized protein LOC111325781 [Stylophora pistillata]